VGLVAGLATGGPISHGPISHGAPAIAAAAAIYAAVVTQLAWMGRRVGRFGWWPVVAYPLSVAAFVGLFAWSVVRTHVLGSVTWRGRRIAVGRQRA
jgi:4,4'-diaponeurosporenoate glycosyltransferase